ncbi:TolC family protein [Anaerovorax odorimutans]|uniref:TolC family protein n=1 Tax=Anaerovorax odorimutans TaxID=109327 RepID=UPI00041E4375|nr:TolC family protein [Anaerovorax odorimutans]
MKRILCAGIATLLIFSSSSMVFSLEPKTETTETSTENSTEDNTENTSKSAITYNLDFSEDETKLSLDEAKKLMITSSSGIETAKINLAGDKAKTENYYHTISNIRRLENAYNGLDYALSKMAVQMSQPGYTPTVEQQIGYITAKQKYDELYSPSKTQKDMARLAATFAKDQSQRNYEAALNSIESETIKTYFQTLQAKDALRIYKDNVSVQETILKNTKIQKEVGTLAKQDVLSAEVALDQAKLDCANMEKTYSLARMSLNKYFGFDLMKNVTLIDNLSNVTPSEIPLDTAIKDAEKNRNEILAADFLKELKTLNLKEVGSNYSQSGPDYLQAKAELMSAEKTSKDAPLLIEMDVKNKYMTMKNGAKQIEVGKLNVDKAKETFRLAQLTYNAGMLTLPDMQSAQLGAFKAELEYSKSLLEYQLAIMDYEKSMTVGTYTVPL